jgi:hypothetical protein
MAYKGGLILKLRVGIVMAIGGVMAQIRDVMAELVAQQTKLLSNEVRV